MNLTKNIFHTHNAQEIAFHKQSFQINGVQFFCQQTYYEGQLLNGVDLKVKQMKGLNPNPRHVDYLQQSQQLIFYASSSFIIYNSYKRLHTQFMNLQGQVIFLKTHFQKNSNHQYILWIQKKKIQSQPVFIANPKSKTKRVGALFKQNKNKNIIKNIIAKSAKNNNQDNIQQYYFQYWLKIYDYTKKQLIFNVKISQSQIVILDLFFFTGQHKVVGLIIQDEYQNNKIIYKRIKQKDQIQNNVYAEIADQFLWLDIPQKINCLKYNAEQHAYIFYYQNKLYSLKLGEGQNNQQFDQFQQYLGMKDPTKKVIKVKVNILSQFPQNILSLSIGQQYLVILTQNSLFVHSAFDTSVLILFHSLDKSLGQVSKIQINRFTVMLLYKNKPRVTSLIIKNKLIKSINTTQLEINHCKQILRIFSNNISSQILCLVQFYQIQGQIKQNFSKDIKSTKNTHTSYVIKPAYIDVAVCYLSSASKSQARLLNLQNQKFLRLHTSPWLSQYLIQSADNISMNKWQQSFLNIQSIALHPTGLFIVICFKQGFKIYAITFQGLSPTFRGDSGKDLICCTVSKTGNHIAVANFTSIYIYDFYKCNKLRTICLPLGLSIQSLLYQGKYLFCCLKNKKVYLYEAGNEYKQQLCFNPKIYCSDTSKLQDQNILNTAIAFAIGRPNVGPVPVSQIYYQPILQFMIFSHRSSIYFYNCVTGTLITSFQIGQISKIYHNKQISTMFFGTNNGEIICFPWPNKPSNLLTDQRKFKIHGSKIIDIIVSSDLREVVAIAQDGSMSVSTLFMIQNLKRLQGIQLIQHLTLSNNMVFDTLIRRGFCLFSKNRLADKNDQFKDQQEQALNLNFILPQERIKQKQIMWSNLNTETSEINLKNLNQCNQLVGQTNLMRDKVNAIKQQLQQLQNNLQQQLQKINKNQHKQYYSYYQKNKKYEMQLRVLKSDLSQKLKQQKNKYQLQLQRYKSSLQNQLNNKLKNLQSLKNNEDKYLKQQLKQMDQQKKSFLFKSLESFQQHVANLNQNNGIIACKNNNLQKQISQLQKRLEEHRFLIFRLQITTQQLLKQQNSYQNSKKQNRKLLEKQDKINLTEIQKRYINQTRCLIQKDKQITIKIISYQKQKATLAQLQKMVESVQDKIDKLIQQLLIHNKQSNQDTLKIQQFRNYLNSLTSISSIKRKQSIIIRSGMKNYLSRLSSIPYDLAFKELFIQMFNKKDLLSREEPSTKKLQAVKQKSKNKQQLKLNIQPDLKNSNIKRYKQRKMNTQGNKTKFNFYKQKSQLKDQIAKKNEKVIFLLNKQKKIYKRIHTEQETYQNILQKIRFQNQDLIQNFNYLAMQNRNVRVKIQKQQFTTRSPPLVQKIKQIHCKKPTPFQNLIQLKNKKKQIKIPPKTYQF